jgi:CRP-like cAMP-binding protein
MRKAMSKPEGGNPMPTKITTQELKRIPLFKELSEDELAYLSQQLEEQEYRHDSLIYQESDLADHLYIVQKGAVEITKPVPTGHRQVIAMILAGRFFGELSFFGKRPHGARARATVDTRLFLLHRFVYDRMEKERPALVHKLQREIVLVVSANLDSMNEMFLQMIHYAFYGGKAGQIEMPGRGVA